MSPRCIYCGEGHLGIGCAKRPGGPASASEPLGRAIPGYFETWDDRTDVKRGMAHADAADADEAARLHVSLHFAETLARGGVPREWRVHVRTPKDGERVFRVHVGYFDIDASSFEVPKSKTGFPLYGKTMRVLEASEVETLRVELEAAQAEVATLRAALEEAREVLALCHTRDFPAPEDAEVRAICERIGFGAVMGAASKTWADKCRETSMPAGGQHTAGPCEVTVDRALAKIDAALSASGAAAQPDDEPDPHLDGAT